MTSFPALLARQSGTLKVSRSGVEFVPDADSMAPYLVIPMAFLQAKTDGKNSDYVFLYNRNQPEVLISVQDFKILEALKSNGFLNGRNFGLKTPTKKRFIISTVILGTIITLLFVVPFVIAKMSGQWIVEQITPEMEREWVRKLVLSDKGMVTPAHLEKSKRQMRILIEDIRSHSPELKPFEIELIVADSEVVNAFAIPGGILMINSGFIKQSQSTEEIIGVLAHELGHIERRHNVKSIVSGLGITAGALALSLLVGADISEWVLRGSNLLNLKYTRDHEREADDRGLYYLSNAKIAATGMIDFFERLSKTEPGGAAANLLAIMSTHPASAERINYLRTKSSQNFYVPRKPLLKISEIKSALK